MNARHIHRLAVAAGLVIVALTAGAFALSYAHLADVAGAHGMTQAWRRWTWPATLDAFIVAGELLMLRAALQGRRDGWAIAATAVGSLGSIALNVAGVGADATPLDHVVAGVPPTAALLAFGLLMRQLHQAFHPATPVATGVAVPDTPAELYAAEQPRRPAVTALWTPADEPAATLLTVADVARERGVAAATVRSWVARGRLEPTTREDGRPLFDPAAVAALG